MPGISPGHGMWRRVAHNPAARPAGNWPQPARQRTALAMIIAWPLLLLLLQASLLNPTLIQRALVTAGLAPSIERTSASEPLLGAPANAESPAGPAVGPSSDVPAVAGASPADSPSPHTSASPAPTAAAAPEPAPDVQLALTGPGTPSTGAASTHRLRPGQRSADYLQIRNSGDTPLGALTLTVTVASTSTLDGDQQHGLRLTVTGCPTAWQGARGAFRCAGPTTTYLDNVPVRQASRTLPMVGGPAGAVQHLLMTQSLPHSADNAFAGQTSRLTYTVQGSADIDGGR